MVCINFDSAKKLNDKMSSTNNRFELLASKESASINLVSNALMQGGANYLWSKGFIWANVPTLAKITGACENVNTLYKTDHFGSDAFLAQTGQLYLEALIPAHEKLWTLITSTRKECDADTRHLNQFKLLELELQTNFDDMLVYVESTVKAMLSRALETESRFLSSVGRYEELSQWVSKNFGRITYSEAIEHLKSAEFTNESGRNIEWGDDLKSEHEIYLSKEIMCNNPFFITHFPEKIKFFNMRINDDNPNIVNSADLIMPYSGESAGCAERENNYERLVQRLTESDMYRILVNELEVDPKEFDDYLYTVRQHPILHSGAGIGFERIVQSVFASSDIRMSASYPIQSNKLY